MSGNIPIPSANTSGPEHHGLASSFIDPLSTPAALAQEVVARDLAQCGDNDAIDDEIIENGSLPGPALYRRPSGVADGGLRPMLTPLPLCEPMLTSAELQRSRDAERVLLHDNHIFPPDKETTVRHGFTRTLFNQTFGSGAPRSTHEDNEAMIAASGATEHSPLLGGDDDRNNEMNEHLEENWEAAIAAGQIKTTWQREAKTIVSSLRSLIVTLVLQYFMNVTSVFVVGRIGVVELSAVSLATLTANITGYSVVQGLASSLDTLCSQAYGSGHKHLVGLQMQRMTCFLLLMVIPIGAIWLNAENILVVLIPSPRSAELAAAYLHVVLCGMPAYVCFECGKRFVQAQGLFVSTTYVLGIVTPVNILLSYLFVWRLGFGFIGAPMAVAISQNLMPILLFLYVWRIDGSQCWGGFSRKAFSNWGPMIRLAIPGMIMMMAEWLAFEILTLTAGQLGTSYLATQTVLMTTVSAAFQLTLPLAIAGSTRVAGLIGSKLVDAAKTSASVVFVGGLLFGLFNLIMTIAFRHQIPLLITDDPEVVARAGSILPLCACLEFFDAMGGVAHGLLRGIGRQEIGGYVNLSVHYILSLPLAFAFTFGLGWKLAGLWSGITIGLAMVVVIEFWFISNLDWNRSVKEAEQRNMNG